MSTYDSSRYRALGVGERVEQGDYYTSPTDIKMGSEPHQCDKMIGLVVNQDDEWTYLRPIASPESKTAPGFNDWIAKEYGITTDIGKAALRIALANIKVLDDKQKDYGSGNIAAFGEYGVLVRTWDKISRLRNLLTNVQDPKNESVEDSWLDLANYAVIAVMCRRGEWK